MPELIVPEPPEERQVPDGIWKQPPERAIPLLKEEVAEEERLIEPPVIVRPADESKPPPATESPPLVYVEVAEPVTLRLFVSTVPVAKNPFAVVVPETAKLP